MDNNISHLESADIPLSEIKEKNSEYFNSPNYIALKEKKGFNQIGLALVFQFILSNVIALVLTFIFGAIAGMENGILSLPAWALPVIYCVTFLIANTVPFILCARKLDINILSMFRGEKFKFTTTLSCVFLCLGVNSIGSMVANILTMILKGFGLAMETPELGLSTSLLGNILMIIATCILAPITEEFIFRGVLIKFFSRKGETFAVVLSALLFSLIHGNLQQAVATFLIGLVFGYVAVKTKSIVIPIIVHMINNGIAMISQYAIENDNITILTLSGLLLLGCGIFTIIYLIIALVKHNNEKQADNTIRRKVKHNGWRLAFTSIPIIISVIIYLGTLVLMTMGWMSV